MKIAHIVHPFTIQKRHTASHLHIAQPVTIKSMLNARNNSNKNIQLIKCEHYQDSIDIPGFDLSCKINRWSKDAIEGLDGPNSFPLVRDIFSSAVSTSDADFFIFTNIDIGLYPHFYDFVFSKINQGLDSFCIDKRVMPKYINGELISEINFKKVFNLFGENHNGVDCFVFKRPTLDQINCLGNVFLGLAPVGTCVQYFCKHFFPRHKWFRNEHVTFHLGEDKAWHKFTNDLSINFAEAKKINFGKEYKSILNSINFNE